MKQAIDYWFSHIQGIGSSWDVFGALSQDLPRLMSLIMDRTCRFECRHCIFQNEVLHRKQSIMDANDILYILSQMQKPKVIHEGRQITKQQVPTLKAISANYEIGIIESGTYVNCLDAIMESGLKFDWLDISIDGPREIHNLQRNSQISFDTAVMGIRKSESILKKNKIVSSLMTLTNLNYSSIRKTRSVVCELGINNWHITTLSSRKGINNLRLTKYELTESINQIVSLNLKDFKPILRIYNLEDLSMIASIFGKKSFKAMLKNAKVTQSALVLDAGFPIYFFPQSLAPNETIVIDIDNWWRLPYCIKYTIEELEKGVDNFGNDISFYSVSNIKGGVDIKSQFAKATSLWHESFGKVMLDKEKDIFINLF